MRNEKQNTESAELDERLGSAIVAAAARQEKVGTLSSLWRHIREENNFRKSLEELFGEG